MLRVFKFSMAKLKLMVPSESERLLIRHILLLIVEYLQRYWLREIFSRIHLFIDLPWLINGVDAGFDREHVLVYELRVVLVLLENIADDSLSSELIQATFSDGKYDRLAGVDWSYFNVDNSSIFRKFYDTFKLFVYLKTLVAPFKNRVKDSSILCSKDKLK